MRSCNTLRIPRLLVSGRLVLAAAGAAHGQLRRARCLIRRKDCGGVWRSSHSLALTQESGDIQTGAVFSATTTLPNLIYKHRFHFVDSTGAVVAGDPADFQQGPLMVGNPWICWAGTAGFEADGVNPDSGPSGTSFQFRVQYADGAGDVPVTARVIVRRNGMIYRQKDLSAAPAGDLCLGKVYRTSISLTEPGAYEYRFSLADASGQALGPPNNWTSGPTPTGGLGVTLTSLTALSTVAGVELVFNLSSAANVSVTVINVAGRPIRTIVANKACDAGLQTFHWDERTGGGLRAPRGLHLVRVVARGPAGARSERLAALALK